MNIFTPRHLQARDRSRRMDRDRRFRSLGESGSVSSLIKQPYGMAYLKPGQMARVPTAKAATLTMTDKNFILDCCDCCDSFER